MRHNPHAGAIVNNLLPAIVMSACFGALVGLIRQWSDQVGRPGEADFGGVRTYTFWAMLGCLGAAGSEKLGLAVLAVVMTLVGAQQIVAMAKMPATSHPGGTTFASVLLTMFTGALVFWGQRQTALLVAATTMVIIGMKQTLHAWTRAFTSEDIRGTMQFVAITGVMLPLLPNQTYGPFNAFNPYSTWLMVVLISGLGFVGYIMMRLLGAKAGTTITGLVGGVASSTATTLAFSRRSKDDPTLSASYTLAVVLACTVMLARMLVIVGVLNRELALSLALPFALMALPGLGFTAWVWFFRRPEESAVATPHLHNPLSLGIAIKFGLIYAVVAFLVKAATSLQWHAGLLPLSFLSGLTDVDAITLLMANNRTDGTVGATVATQAVILAAIANSLMKAGLAVSLGAPALRRQIAFVLGLTAVVGGASLWLVR
jgi:uncharacterized membrane protein (DUF4010 family)